MVSAKKTVILLCVAALSSGCGAVKQSARPPSAITASGGGNAPDSAAAGDRESFRPPSAMNVSVVNSTRASLMQAYREWKGTPYRLGGASESGVDCSMFINIVFADYFDMDLPTNTRTQLNVGEGVRRTAVRTGDLIFFRTGRNRLHVGIMVDREEFLHASTSRGVTISELSREYWANRYLAARRVL
ncbi:lipoprotein Spr/probable lipoprotein NlpC [Fodinibius roseus]|uniref:Lipoprotein Spr/probable lipoprotein NlpC n=1 Tax=Fodinibius roseus TaxID=1194090 RepID=A0A1M4UL87_9BACT|nr:NlpC/P60 family protein [Fodinibius roseus]SHE57427.1 lipoprotein Spr/probable lipoprotein NlpC [Fodinibius roseus]